MAELVLRPLARTALLPRIALVAAGFLLAALLPALAQPFRLPTANRALFEASGPAAFFAPTAGKTWTAGQFGCVRSEGTQMHEGIDILSIEKDRRGEPTDPVLAAADGQVAYISRRAALSNYGTYVVLRHKIEGLEVLTLYAHLRSVRSNLTAGASVKAGEAIGIVGRTTNTRSPIGKERAHLHFEIDLLVNDRYPAWLRKTEPGTQDDHGAWNGRNLLGVDPAEVFRLQQKDGNRFSLLHYLRSQRAMCRVLLADTRFPWLRRFPQLVRPNPKAQAEGIVAYEASLNFNGLPFQLIPRARSEIEGPLQTRLLAVDAAEHQSHPCRKLVFKRGQAWTLTARGQQLLDLITY